MAEDAAYVTMDDIREAKSATRNQLDPPSSESDHYVSMDAIRATKKSTRHRTSPTIEVVYQDPHSVVSSEDNVSDLDVPSCSGTSASAHSSLSGDKNEELDLPVTRKVVVYPGPSGLGISIAGGVKSPAGLLPVLITDIDHGGLIESTGVIQVGDNIVSVNGETMVGKTHRDVVLAIKGAGSSLMLEVMECPENIKRFMSIDE